MQESGVIIREGVGALKSRVLRVTYSSENDELWMQNAERSGVGRRVPRVTCSPVFSLL
jgi:hypothetical protein